MKLLDTTFLIDFFNGNEAVRTFLEQHRKELATTSLNYYEVLRQALPKEKPLIKDFLDTLRVYPFTQDTAQVATRVYSECKAKGKMVPNVDLLIASIALEHRASLVTSNLKDFKNIRDLKVEVH